MKIDIDASRAFIKERTGTEEYSYKLIKNLTILDTSGHQIFLYVKNREEINFKLPENYFIKEIKRNKLWTQLGLSKEMRKNSVDVLFIPAHSIPFVHPKNTIVTIHGLEFKYFPENYSWKERMMLEFNTLLAVKWSKKIIVPSESTKRDLMKFYKVSSERIKVIYHGVSSIQYPVSSIKNRDKDGSNILFIGRLERRKNIVNLINAFNLFKDKNINNKNCKLILVGKKGFGFEEIQLVINQSSYKKDIIVKGYVSEAEKTELYQNASLFVLISFYEGFGLPILEAMSHGVPVICSNVSSLPEITGEAGLMVNPNDVKEVAEGFEKIICNQDVKNDMIKKGYENTRKFSWEKCAKKTMDVLLNY
ncbi:MAG: glycosyltransferase family 4 protein [Candidatus Pacebacteria bacterium]|nr:glycosyltransferase family 4 protein [Candidatus Paceibacterota bacterium]